MRNPEIFTDTRHCRRAGFTLVELMICIVIVVILAALAFTFSGRALDKANKVRVMQQMRDVGMGIDAFIVDYRRPPLPRSKTMEPRGTNREGNIDTIYGDPGGLYGSEAILGALTGGDEEYPTSTEEVFSADFMNPKGNVYYTPVVVDDERNGMGREDGKFYGPWGREIMFAVNGWPYRQTENTKSEGASDKKLWTWELAEWTDKKPRYQSHVMWSYGKDGEKADTYGGSDDVAVGF